MKQTKILAIILVMLIAILSTACDKNSGDTSNESFEKWEYMVLNIAHEGGISKNTIDSLNKLGAEGWELVIAYAVYRHEFILKRRVR